MKMSFLYTFYFSPSAESGMHMFYGASNLIFQRAEELRNTMTPAEEIIWKAIHINEWKLKFRRQHPIANYVVDFYCHALKLVIEIDSSIHEVDEVKRNDAYRQQHLQELGLNVLRISNEEIFKNKKNILEIIKQKVNELKNPSLGDRGKLYVIKIGGNIIDDEKKLSSFLQSFASLQFPKILVHGGGRLATKLAAQLGIEQQLIDG